MKLAKKLRIAQKRIQSKAIDLVTTARKNAKFILALITAFALIWQNCTIRTQVNLYEKELQDEQKPILYRGVGEYGESYVLDNQLIVTEHIMNIGKLPTYNVTRRYAIRNAPEYPYQHFTDLMDQDSLYRNILLPGIPRIDTLSIGFDSSSDSVSLKELAYGLYASGTNVYVHFWTEYVDIAERFYVLQQTFELHGRADSTLFWSAYHAIDEEIDNPYK